jgi:hypothetical protein
MVKDKTCVVSRVTELVQSHVTTASLQSEISAELSYLLPFDESANFENLLLEICLAFKNNHSLNTPCNSKTPMAWLIGYIYS